MVVHYRRAHPGTPTVSQREQRRQGALSDLSRPPLADYCNAPHVNPAHYQLPRPRGRRRGEPALELVHVTSFQRHAKRTPDNLVPGNENAYNPRDGWNCVSVERSQTSLSKRPGTDVDAPPASCPAQTTLHTFSYANSHGPPGYPFAPYDNAVPIQPATHTPASHPFLPLIWNGTCDAGQLTAGGLRDVVQHGRNFMAVYGPQGKAPLLGLGAGDGAAQDTLRSEVYVRASPAPRTAQVAGGYLRGMLAVLDEATKGSQRRARGADAAHFSVAGRDDPPASDAAPFKIHIEPSNIDSITPSYSCEYASTLRTAIEDSEGWKSHLASSAVKDLFTTINDVLGTSYNSDWNSWIDHAFDMLASRQCHGHALPRNSTTGRSISEEVAHDIYAEGDWEYNFIWNQADEADDYVKYSIGALVMELTRTLKQVQSGRAAERAKLFIGHDGTMVRLLKTLAQSGTIRWPALGSEVVFEVWRDKTAQAGDDLFVRILVSTRGEGGSFVIVLNRMLTAIPRRQSYGRTLASNAPQLTGAEKGAEVSWVSASA